MADKMQEHAVEDLKNDIAKLRADFAGLGEDVKKLLEIKAAWAGKVGSAIGAEAGEAWAEVQHKLKAARARGEKAVDDAAVTIADHPWQSVAVACGVGVLIGLLLHKRSRQ